MHDAWCVMDNTEGDEILHVGWQVDPGRLWSGKDFAAHLAPSAWHVRECPVARGPMVSRLGVAVKKPGGGHVPLRTGGLFPECLAVSLRSSACPLDRLAEYLDDDSNLRFGHDKGGRDHDVIPFYAV